ncbi:MAG: PAS domain S-box protein [Verrucomicrobia bacterium]|nr:PAS domain S-box protein [Verrucomicrobiota bacterium]
MVAGLVGLACGVSWMLGLPSYAVVGPTFFVMAPLAAWLMALLSTALFLRAGWPASKPVRLFVFGSAAAIGFMSLLILWVRLQNLELMLEPWLWRGVVAHNQTVGRMAALAAALFIMAAVALLCLLEPPGKWKNQAWQRVATGLALTILLVVSGVFLGYMSGAHMLVGGYRMPVAMTAALAFILVAVGIVALTRHGERWLCHVVGESWVGVDAQSQRFRASLLAAFVVLVAAIGVTGFMHLRHQTAHAREATQNELAAIARLKTEQIVAWRADRLRDARFFARSELARREVQAFLNNPASESAKVELLRWLSLLKAVNSNARLFLFDRDMNVRLALSEDAKEAGSLSRQHAAAAFVNPEPVFVDLHRDGPDAEPHLDMVFGVVPPDARDGAAPPIAAVVLQLDPRTFLYPLIQSWPTPSPTAETGLLRCEGDRVLFLSSLRHRTNTALNLSFPLDSPDLPAAIFLRGNEDEQLVEGLDYRGAPVLTLFRRIPDSPWILGAKVDQEEVFASLRQQTWATILTVILLIAVVALVVVLLWRQRLSDSLRRELGLERERKQLADRLALLMRHANDIIVLAGADLKIVEANDRALEAYGYTLEEMRRMKISDLRAQESRGRFTSQMAVVQSQGSAVFETIHRRKDGSSFRAEVSSRTVEIDGVPYYLAITRDITERRRALTALRESESLYHSLVEHLPQAIYRLDRAGRITFANAHCCEQMGCAPQDLVGKSAFDLFPAEQATRYWNDSRRVMETGDTLDTVERHQRPDGRESFAHIVKSPLRGGDGQIIGVQCLFWDVTERKRSEEALRAIETRYRSLFQNMLNGFAYCRMIYEGDRAADFVYVAVNSVFETLTGLKDVVGRKVSEVIPGIREKDPELFETYGRVARTGVPEKFETYVESLKMWFSISVYRPQEGYFVAVFDVITARKEAEKALREAERKYRGIFENAVEGIFQSTPDGKILSANPAMAAIHGYASPEEFIAGIHDIAQQLYVDPGRREEVKRLLETHGEVKDFENRVRRKDGRLIWVSGNTRAVRDATGKILHYEGTVEDITARKEAEQAVRESERRFQQLFEMAPNGYVLCDSVGTIVHGNRAAETLLGYQNEELAGKNILKAGVLPLDELPKAAALLARCMLGNPTGPDEITLLRKDQSRVDTEFCSKPVTINDQRFLLGTVINITARKEAEKALRASQSALLMAQRLAHVGNWEWNPATDETFWSEEIFRIFGRDPKLGPAGIKEVSKYYSSESWARLKAAVETTLAQGIPYECDVEVVRDDGAHRWITTRGEAVRAADGTVISLRGSVQDITERKRAADEIHQLNQTLEQRVRERTAQLEASNRELESFCYSVSHDLRAPLRAINGFASILTQNHARQLDDEGRRTLGIVCAEALRMGQLIDDLLEFSRIGRQSMQQAEIDMAVVARRAFNECAAHAPGRNIRFKLHPLPPAQGDPALLPHVWTNLLSNAIKYTRPKPTAEIEITGRMAGGELVYCVKDNGVGFDMQYAEKLFGVFQRLHGETDFEGTGVGLALVQRIILRHGGRVWADARINEGAAFYFTLPANKPGGP